MWSPSRDRIHCSATLSKPGTGVPFTASPSAKPGEFRTHPDEAMELLREQLKGSRYAECSPSRGRCADLSLDEDPRRLWSPYLSIQLEGLSGPQSPRT